MSFVNSWCVLHTAPTFGDGFPHVWLRLPTECAIRFVVVRCCGASIRLTFFLPATWHKDGMLHTTNYPSSPSYAWPRASAPPCCFLLRNFKFAINLPWFIETFESYYYLIFWLINYIFFCRICGWGDFNSNFFVFISNYLSRLKDSYLKYLG